MGIWGMGGVGKTTIAKVVYQMMSHQFQGCCFVHDVRQRVQAGGMMKLQEEIISKVLGETDSLKYMFSAGPGPFLITRLGRKKMLIVLDDVSNSLQIESLVGDPCWFGLESMILITSRDKQIFEGRANFIYEVIPLDDFEALQLFSKRAFKQNYPRDEYVSLSNSIVKYAQGNPLALKVLGSSLFGKKKKEWGSTLDQLLEIPNKDIQSVLQISYEGLNRVEKDVFLDIACFFKCGINYVHTSFMRQIYKNNRFNIDIVLSVLVDKCVLTISKYGRVEMHDLLQEMGKEIVRQEAKYPSERSRLWDPEDIYEVFMENKEAERVESIILDLTKIKEINLDPKVFMKMPNLKFLDFYGSYEEKSNLHLSQGLDYLPNKMRYFCWFGYPLEAFPPSFYPENLMVLQLPNSKIKQFWNGTKEENSMASRQTYGMFNTIVNSFLSLVKIPSYSFGSGLGKLTSLSLVNIKSITHLPNSRSRFLEALEVLDLSFCSNLKTFPEISSNIKELFLTGTAIKQIPSSSVELLNKLKILWMMNCRELESFPSNFFSKMTSLQGLYLQGSLRFKELPEILDPMDNLKFLNLNQTAIEKLPSSVSNLKRLEVLQTSFLNLKNCFIEDHHAMALWLDGISSLTCLSLSNSNLRELPEDLSFLSSVETLNLSGNDFEIIPPTIKQLSRLTYLDITNCKRLQSLPELPLSISRLYANACRSLRQICAPELVLEPQEVDEKVFRLWNCIKLDEDECQVVANALLKNHLSAFTRNQMQKSLTRFQMSYPGSRIPEWVKYQSPGDSIQIHLPPHWLNHLSLGFAFYLCLDSVGKYFSLRYDCYSGDSCRFSSADFHSDSLYFSRLETEHVMVFIGEKFCEWVCRHGNFEETVAFFKFTSPVEIGIKKCGVIPLYAQQDEDEFYETFDFPTLGVSKWKRSAGMESTYSGSFHCTPKKRMKIKEIE